mmetsp:Transcript_24644/g.45940  ORF Transcript_24644/g.45940 Transcript_24644/m.45940 type:complete len:246 (-) Transcript_24644:274-1011(-)|eukprot:CAMPEP_0114435660 /NCGR_PEP_ID=MMETSP0103-20121206/12965_1 /TAXON_ID=37642 ORGANISM="Paraphysomonas imperforata, Strain PA2" /NCGR_SAMPLE_ID=MMETSP0103 /ASSEMBLY_ACC=CAM_ASM_000201 /LENGTH=245 /DNA_ID=CAMNT_0001605733 /DNA_START=202 /DNA_END=939 /DNA_ORIENTATION=-
MMVLNSNVSDKNSSNITRAPTLMPSSVPTAAPSTHKTTSDHISDQDFTVGVLIVVCAAGVALLLIAVLRLQIATIQSSIDDAVEQDEADDSGHSDLVIDTVVNPVGGKGDESGEILNDEVEEHGVDYGSKRSGLRATGRGRSRPRRFDPLPLQDSDEEKEFQLASRSRTKSTNALFLPSPLASPSSHASADASPSAALLSRRRSPATKSQTRASSNGSTPVRSGAVLGVKGQRAKGPRHHREQTL